MKKVQKQTLLKDLTKIKEELKNDKTKILSASDLAGADVVIDNVSYMSMNKQIGSVLSVGFINSIIQRVKTYK